MKTIDKVVGIDLAGCPFNRKYPPNIEKYGNRHDGYESLNKKILFYEFAVQNYDLHFKYRGRDYHFVTGKDHVALCDEHYTKEYKCFPDANTMIEQFEIDGKKLIDIIDELEDVEQV